MLTRLEYLNNWLKKAENDLKVAQHELTFEHEATTDAICFHCQQAVEKYLKAFLIFQNQDFGKTHNLEFLNKLCSELDKEFTSLDLGNLSSYAVQIRYPDDFYTPELEEAKQALALATDIKKFINKKINK